MATLGRRRALGQHFLKDVERIRQIIEKSAAEITHHGCTAVLEIGPGKGALTLPLMEALRKTGQVRKLQLVERDQKLATHWKNEADLLQKELPFEFTVESGDFLELPESLWLNSQPLAVISNLPYSAGTAILNRLARHGNLVPVMVLMFQAEVAQRLRAEASTSARGSLSVWIQNLWDVKKFLDVPPRSFLPPPEVNSEVIVMTRREAPRISGTTDSKGAELWESLLKACFSQRRKMLRSVLKSPLNSRRTWQNALELSGVDGTRRADALLWQEWDQLFQAARQVSGL